MWWDDRDQGSWSRVGNPPNSWLADPALPRGPGLSSSCPSSRPQGFFFFFLFFLFFSALGHSAKTEYKIANELRDWTGGAEVTPTFSHPSMLQPLPLTNGISTAPRTHALLIQPSESRKTRSSHVSIATIIVFIPSGFLLSAHSVCQMSRPLRAAEGVGRRKCKEAEFPRQAFSRTANDHWLGLALRSIARAALPSGTELFVHYSRDRVVKLAGLDGETRYLYRRRGDAGLSMCLSA